MLLISKDCSCLTIEDRNVHAEASLLRDSSSFPTVRGTMGPKLPKRGKAFGSEEKLYRGSPFAPVFHHSKCLPLGSLCRLLNLPHLKHPVSEKTVCLTSCVLCGRFNYYTERKLRNRKALTCDCYKATHISWSVGGI